MSRNWTRTITPPISEFTPAPSGVLQRKYACGMRSFGEAKSRCDSEENQSLPLHRKTARAGDAHGVPPIVHEVLNLPGQSLDAATRSFMEPRFGHDFGNVQIHIGPKAAESARSVSALAYTVGQHIVFGKEQYAPGTRNGRELIAHELTHTIQQGNAGTAANKIGEPSDSSEKEASQATEKIMFGAANNHPIFEHGIGVIRRRDESLQRKTDDSASVTARTDNVTAEDARKELISRIGLERYRALERRLMGGTGPGESEAESTGRIVAAGGVAPQISRLADARTLQAASVVLPVAGAVAAIALCAFGFYFYALKNFPGKNDKWLHCWTSCKIAAWCGGPMPGPGPGSAISLLLGLGKEVIDAICDALGGPCGAEWEDVFADLKGIGCAAVPVLPCDTCCDRIV